MAINSWAPLGPVMEIAPSRLLVIMETELWPNMLHYSELESCRIVLANARMSERSAAGYARFNTLPRTMLESVNVVACQSQIDGERLLSLGLPDSSCL